MQTVSRTEYVAELNRRLELHPDYLPGMLFIMSPEGAEPEQAIGYSWLPPGLANPFTEIANAVLAEFTT
jgi:hypothetical protein